MFNDKFVNRTLQLFIRFLKEEKIIGVFNRNFSMYLKKIDKAQYVNIYSLFLDYAMTWDETEKGFRFWERINVKWRTYFFNNFELIKKEINEK